MIRVARLAVLLGAIVLLTACSAGTGYSDLDRAATDGDRLPAELPGYASADFVEGSVRLAGEHDDTRYFLAWSDQPAPNSACVVMFRSAEDWAAACGGRGGPTTLSSAGRTVVLAPDGHPDLDRGERMGSNLAVVD